MSFCVSNATRKHNMCYRSVNNDIKMVDFGFLSRKGNFSIQNILTIHVKVIIIYVVILKGCDEEGQRLSRLQRVNVAEN